MSDMNVDGFFIRELKMLGCFFKVSTTICFKKTMLKNCIMILINLFYNMKTCIRVSVFKSIEESLEIIQNFIFLSYNM